MISAHHKSVVFFSAFALVFGVIGVITGACSMLSDVIFFFGAKKTREMIKESSKDTVTEVRRTMKMTVWRVTLKVLPELRADAIKRS
ncbi:hypothetical protein DICVIV_03692 [Dictyocaulus viviparus]|uniref:Uncharacterized protein n=1 Tax=Dictyocaulus viviparus TaxID=29172 RepID=A0A0D8Y2E6_DICVI|nr:hypothetical protein DICVIV_03692 [Dictyocaulus viviparus]